MDRAFEFSPEDLAERAASYALTRDSGASAARNERPTERLLEQAEDTEFLEGLSQDAPALSLEEARSAWLAGVAEVRLGHVAEVGALLERHDADQRIVDSWSSMPTEGRRSDDYLALGRLKETKEALARYAPQVEQVRELWSASREVEDQIQSLAEVRQATLADQTGRRFGTGEPFTTDTKETKQMPELSREDERALLSADVTGLPVQMGVSAEFVRYEAETIRTQAAMAVPEEMAAVHAAYLNGRATAFNLLREDLVDHDRSLEQDRPPAIRLDEIVVRQRLLEQEQGIEKTQAISR